MPGELLQLKGGIGDGKRTQKEEKKQIPHFVGNDIAEDAEQEKTGMFTASQGGRLHVTRGW